MPCDGNPAETCGGPNRLDLYTFGYGNGTALVAELDLGAKYPWLTFLQNTNRISGYYHVGDVP